MRTRGVTLIEIMVVVAIIGIIGSLAVSTTEGLRARTAPRNSAADFSSALSTARARATERGTDVWLIIYPEGSPKVSTAGNGAWFLYEDPDVNFGNTGSATCDGSAGSTCNFANFSPPDNIWAPPLTATSFDRLLDSEYLDRAAKKNVKFGNTTDPTVVFGEPFGGSGTGLNGTTVAKDCSFCTGTGLSRRGAIVFNGDGAARFVDGNGVPSWEPTGGIALQAADGKTKLVTRFGIASVTGYVGVFQ